VAVARQATEKPQATQAPAEREEGGFLDDLAGGIASVREKALGTLAGWARRVPGYGLLCVVLGRDPVTGAAVPRTPASLVGGFVSLIPGGQAMFENLQRAGAVDRAATWFADQVDRLGLTWDAIRGLFSRAWDALGVTDLLDPAGAWAKLAGIFGPPLERLRSFAAAAGSKVLEFVFEGVLSLAGSGGEQVMAIVRRAGDVLGTIVRDPIGFAGNLIAAVRGGLGRFLANIAGHLRTGLFAWLTGALRGAVALPGRLDWRGILGFALEVLGLTWAWVRSRLVRLIGEPVVRTLETAVDWVRSIVTGGLGAIADRILGFASGLLDTIIGGIRDWVANSVVGAAITRLLTMFNPAGAIIQAILAVYNTVQFFIERAQQLGALAASVFDSIGAIAAGSLGNAITAVEQAMARTLPVVLGFLARLLGLGDLATPVRNVINRARTLLDQALDKVVSWIAGVARRIASAIRGRHQQPPADAGAPAHDDRTPEQKLRAVEAAGEEIGALLDGPPIALEEVHRRLPAIRERHRLTSVELRVEGQRTGPRTVVVDAALNPRKRKEGRLADEEQHVQQIRHMLVEDHGFPRDNIQIAGAGGRGADLIAFDEDRLWIIEVKGRRDWMDVATIEGKGSTPARQIVEKLKAHLTRPFKANLTVGEYLAGPADRDPARSAVVLVVENLETNDALLALTGQAEGAFEDLTWFPVTMDQVIEFLYATVQANPDRLNRYVHEIAEIRERWLPWRNRSSPDIRTWIMQNADIAPTIERAYADCRRVATHELRSGQVLPLIGEDAIIRLLPVLRHVPSPR